MRPEKMEHIRICPSVAVARIHCFSQKKAIPCAETPRDWQNHCAAHGASGCGEEGAGTSTGTFGHLYMSAAGCCQRDFSLARIPTGFDYNMPNSEGGGNIFGTQEQEQARIMPAGSANTSISDNILRRHRLPQGSVGSERRNS